ncbi:tRNA (guanosine(37)-N1)-methyltransferase TrmD [Candidatus Shapirobacteria bacterium CG09_land_8_20_14_0_10_38_17]|uniref:tRNA (guanine-N(1)-)-methyltransferase n=1 Tax=Candidatus Shapirobacteria bacterium CG09_land_8_20_14_0_10_38_17 TaxID=1974884 RepID=A0A2H0WRD2_9BACT|nr:MAG: tRNA (guanosine(37)-N1)-methyltransferase TrmD [Candidatus Shapirobacteria bacterium CG09_land_8_20_14_0_10_38_17]
MTIHLLTLFPKMFRGPFAESIIKRAQEKGLVEIKIHNLRDWAIDKRGTVDDRPYGGGAGMVLRVEPIYNALHNLTGNSLTRNRKTILLTPRGKTFNQKKARQLAKLDEIILICGHYEGFDERIRKFVDEEISLGNFVLTGGEIPAMAITDTIVRLLPGVLKKEKATTFESFSSGLKKLSPQLLTLNFGLLTEYPQYTRPEEFRGLKVPKILLSGNHQKILEWQKRKIKNKK